MILLLSLCIIYFAGFAGSARSDIKSELISPMLTNWGHWYFFDECPEGTYVVGMQLRTHDKNDRFTTNSTDIASLTGIKFFCDQVGHQSNSTYIISKEEPSKGEYGREFFCKGVATGFQLNSMAHIDQGDDTAANNLRLRCNSDNSLQIQGDGLTHGQWTAFQECPRGQVLCSYSSQVEDDLRVDDFTGINNIRMKCCTTPDPIEICDAKDSLEYIAGFNNSMSDPQEFEYTQYRGLSISESTSDSMSQLADYYLGLDFSIPKIAAKIKLKFEIASSVNGKMEYNWTETSSQTWNQQQEFKAKIRVAPKQKAMIFQYVGQCGFYAVEAPEFLVAEANLDDDDDDDDETGKVTTRSIKFGEGP